MARGRAPVPPILNRHIESEEGQNPMTGPLWQPGSAYRVEPPLVAFARAGMFAIFFLGAVCGTNVPEARSEAGTLGLSAPKTISFADRSLHLNGQGRRIQHFLVLYGCALYLERPGASLQEIKRTDTAAAFRIEITFDLLPADMPDGWVKGIQRAVTARQFEMLKTAYRNLRAGDVVLIWYEPRKGTTVVINGGERVSTTDDALFKAFMSLWLDDSPLSNSLKAALLQGKF